MNQVKFVVHPLSDDEHIKRFPDYHVWKYADIIVAYEMIACDARTWMPLPPSRDSCIGRIITRVIRMNNVNPVEVRILTKHGVELEREFGSNLERLFHYVLNVSARL